ncbi:hypothetical protein [Priestia sp. YIM B13489]|uniref:hypothetical protein n=1 Tax=Priestia sp. YIM B13489 TaxID=3366313 RepID=UPI0036701D98
MAEVKVKPLFKEAKKVIATYQEEVQELDERERELETEAEVLQGEMTSNLVEQETANVGTLVYLKIQAKEINQKAEVINVLLEELKEERTELKLKYVPLIRSALGESPYPEYKATEIVEKYKYQMLSEISEIGKQMRTQYYEIAPEVAEIYEDPTVNERYPRLKYHFTYDKFKPSFYWLENSVVAKSEVFNACDGQNIKKPKGVN